MDDAKCTAAIYDIILRAFKRRMNGHVVPNFVAPPVHTAVPTRKRRAIQGPSGLMPRKAPMLVPMQPLTENKLTDTMITDL